MNKLKKLILGLSLVIGSSLGLHAQANYNFNVGGLGYSSGASVPTSCAQDGSWFWLNTGSKAWYVCANGVYVASGSSSGTASFVSSGALAEYKMTEGSGTTLNDTSGAGNNATLCTSTAAPTWLSNAFTNQAGPGGGSQTSTAPATGGLGFNGANSQCVNLSAAVNSALSFIFITNWTPTTGASNNQNLIVGLGAAGHFRNVLANFQDQSGAGGLQTLSGGSARGSIAGTHVVGVSFATNLHVYFDGQEAYLYNNQATPSNVMDQSTYSLGSPQGQGSRGNSFTGNMYYFAAWNRVLTSAEWQQMYQYLAGIMQSRGIQPQYGFYPNNTISGTNVLLADGDSITNGNNYNTTTYPVNTTLNGTWMWANTAVQGTGFIITNGFGHNVDNYTPDVWYSPNAERNAAVMWAGTNDIARSLSANNVLGGYRNYCNQRRIKGWKCFVVTMISRNTFDTGKNTLNGLLRTEWPTFADGLIDLAELPELGADGATANTNFFNADGLHPLAGSVQWLEGPYISRALNRYYGNNTFSSATTYGSATTAATAITAASETGNTVTFTSTLNPGVGKDVSITGVTPAGYNQHCYTQTSTASNFTCYNTNSGLGAGSAFGTAQVPSQVDADQYLIVNFGAGNFLLQSCEALTGSRVYIKNINAVGSTIVPNSSETIDGAANITVAAGATAILEDVLTSATAGGCSWKRVSNN